MKAKQIIGHIMVETALTVPEWAASKGYTKAAVYNAINGKTKRGQIINDIAEAIHKPVDEIWPPEEQKAV